MGDEAVKQDTAGERFKGASNEFQQGGFAAGIGSEDGDDFGGARLKAAGFESEERRLRRVGGVGVADLLDAKANVAGGARGVACGRGGWASGGHARRLR